MTSLISERPVYAKVPTSAGRNVQSEEGAQDITSVNVVLVYGKTHVAPVAGLSVLATQEFYTAIKMCERRIAQLS